MPSDLDALIDTYLAETWADSPVTASALGVDGFDDRLSDMSAAAFEERDRREDRWLATFSAVPDDGLSLDEAIDRDLLLSALRGSLVTRDRPAWRRDPGIYVGHGLQGVFTLFLNRLHPDADLARFASARLRQVPEVLAQGRANLDPSMVTPLAVKRATGQCGAGVAYARDLVPAEVPDGPLRRELAEAGAVAAEAFQAYLGFLSELGQVAEGDWRLGEDRYSALLVDKELLGYGAREMRDRGQAAFDELDAQMAEVSAKVDGDPDWRSVMEALNQDHPPTLGAMRDEYDEWTQRCRDFLVEHDLVSFAEGERCIVDPSPPFQRPIAAVASYAAPPPFKPTLVGHFFVPYTPDGASEEEIRKRLETNSRASIPTVAAHEAYPGHHWHLTWMQGNPRPARNVVRTPYFVEGWGLYSERLMHEHGFFADPRHELAHLDARIFRAARIVVDTSLHMGDMEPEEAVQFMVRNASLSEPTAVAEVERYCSWPTQASSYLTGSIEIERIRARYLAEGRGSLKAFNDAIALSGGLPIALAERAVLG